VFLGNKMKNFFLYLSILEMVLTIHELHQYPPHWALRPLNNENGRKIECYRKNQHTLEETQKKSLQEFLINF